MHQIDYVIPTDHRVKNKEDEKQNKYMDLAWEHKKNVKYKWYGDSYYILGMVSKSS